jgi:hypothetical protein
LGRVIALGRTHKMRCDGERPHRNRAAKQGPLPVSGKPGGLRQMT